MVKRKTVLSSKAPQPIGPYSQAVIAGDMVYCSGQIPLDPETGLLVDGDLEAQTTRVLDNLDAVLRESDSSLDQTVKLTVFLTDLRNFDILNRVMARRFSSEPPARSVVQVAALPKGAALEMDLIALRNSAGKG